MNRELPGESNLSKDNENTEGIQFICLYSCYLEEDNTLMTEVKNSNKLLSAWLIVYEA